MSSSLNLVFKRFGAPLSDFFQIFGVVDEHLHAHLHAELVEVEVQTGDLGVVHEGGHLLAGAHHLEDVAFAYK